MPVTAFKPSCSGIGRHNTAQIKVPVGQMHDKHAASLTRLMKMSIASTVHHVDWNRI